LSAFPQPLQWLLDRDIDVLAGVQTFNHLLMAALHPANK
jgi:hypothetical protein